MTIAVSLATFFIIWWLVLFTVLPLGVRTQDEEGAVEPGTMSSAPVSPQMGPKLLLTTVIACIVFAAVYSVIVYELVKLEDIPFLPRYERPA